MSKEEKEEMARGAILRLLRLAQAKLETGKSGEMPLDDIARAKSFFNDWENRSSYSILFFLSHIVTLFFFFARKSDMYFSVFLVVLVSVFYFLYGIGKRRRVYIKYLIGDMSNMRKEDRDLYIKGLRYEIWRILDEPIMIKKIVVGVLMVAGGIIMGGYGMRGEGILFSLLGMAVLYIGGTHTIEWENK